MTHTKLVGEGGIEKIRPRELAALSLKVNRYFEQPVIFMVVFLVFVVAFYMNWGARRSFFAAIRFEFTVALFLLFACSVLLANSKIDFSKSRNVLLAAGALLFFMIVQIPFAADTQSAKFIFFERGVLKFSMMAFFIIVMVQSPRTLLWFLLAFLFACFYVTQESTQGLISGGLYWENQGVMRLHGSVRMYAHPNSLAGLAMGVIPFVVFLFPVIKSKIVRLGLVAVFSTSIICVIFSGSRTAYVAILSFLFFWWLVSPNKIRFLLIACVVIVSAYPLVPQQYRDRFKSIAGEEAEGHSRDSRILILKDAGEVFLSNPAGVGLASFPAVRVQKFGRRQDTHNLYLEIATNLGVQGLVAFFVLIYFMFKGNYISFNFFQGQVHRFAAYGGRSGLSPSVKKAVNGFQSDLRLLAAVSKAISGFIFIRLMLGFFGMDLYEIYWWFAVGLTVALLNMIPKVYLRVRMLEAIMRNDGERSLFQAD